MITEEWEKLIFMNSGNISSGRSENWLDLWKIPEQQRTIPSIVCGRIRGLQVNYPSRLFSNKVYQKLESAASRFDWWLTSYSAEPIPAYKLQMFISFYFRCILYFSVEGSLFAFNSMIIYYNECDWKFYLGRLSQLSDFDYYKT